MFQQNIPNILKMRKYIQNKLAMYKVVRQLLGENQAQLESIPALSEIFNSFSNKVAELEFLGMRQGADITGYKKAQVKLRQDTTALARSIAGIITAYAVANGNEVLKAKMHLNSRKFDRSSREQYLSKLQEIIDTASSLESELTNYGIHANHIADLEIKYNTLREDLYVARLKIVERKHLTAAINSMSKELDELLTQSLDHLIKLLKFSHAPFYTKYLIARNIVKYGTRHEAPPSEGSGLAF